MAPRTVKVGQSIVVGGIRVLIKATRGQRVTLGFELAGDPKQTDTIEISVDATARDLQFQRLCG